MSLRKKRFKKIAVSLFVLVLYLAGYVQIDKANAVDSLRIKIGYFGWPTSDYVQKASFSWRDLEDMGVTETPYSYFSGTQVAIDSARGVPLSSVLDEAGIDQSSIAQLDFYTADQENGAFQSFTKQELFQTRRYYFTDLAGHLSYDEDGNIVADRSVWDGARRVSPMLALEENWTWYEVGTSGAAGNFTMLNTANRFRLNFGQSDPLEQKTYASAKMVHTIYVMFMGSPKISADESNLDAKVGSDHKVKITAAAADEQLEEKIQGNLVWSSSDNSVVSVDQDGTLHYNGVGTATVTASYGKVSTQISITVTDDKENNNENSGGSPVTEDKKEDNKEEKREEEKTVPEKKQKNSSQKPKKGSAAGNDSANDNNTSSEGGSNAMETSEQSNITPAEEEQEVTSATGVFVLSRGAGKNLKLAFARQAAAEEASMNTVQEEMDSDAEQLIVKKEEDSRMMLVVGIVMMQILVCGFVFGSVKYYLQA